MIMIHSFEFVVIICSVFDFDTITGKNNNFYITINVANNLIIIFYLVLSAVVVSNNESVSAAIAGIF